jgi:hypothetical protein
MLEQVHKAFIRARSRRADWEPLWRDCYLHTSQQRGSGQTPDGVRSGRLPETLFDSTAADAVEQLAASLLAELMPPWSQWFGLRAGHDIELDLKPGYTERLEAVAERVHGHFDRSTFSIEMHQCLLDLVTVGTGTLLFVEAPPGSPSAFEFHAVPASEMFLDGDHNGQIRRQFRRSFLTIGALRQAFPRATLPAAMVESGAAQPDRVHEVVEAVTREPDGYAFVAYLPEGGGSEPRPYSLAEGRFARSPFLTFRWLKAAGELYGRSPVMTALPDIKTANKVVELVLKNAAIAATGIWLADDDGVLNTATVELAPGSIITKAVGSAGLTPLQAPGRFDVSELVLQDMRTRIRHTLLTDRLGPVHHSRMTATEVLERSTETARILGAVFGRLQAELLTPLIDRALWILARRGEAPPLRIDGQGVEIDYRSPLARAQARDDVTNALLWLETLRKLGPGAAEVADLRAAALWLARMLGVPAELVLNDPAIVTPGSPLAGAGAKPGDVQ